MKSKVTIALPAGVARHFKNGDKIKLLIPFIRSRNENGDIIYHPNFGLSHGIYLENKHPLGSVNFQLKDYGEVVGFLCESKLRFKDGEVTGIVVTSSDKKCEMSLIITDSWLNK